MNPIYIIGYMGAGKSTLGRKLAEVLGFDFIDTDIFIESRFRERIVDMFNRIGEEKFRLKEHYVIEELSGMTDCVIATGGGLPCFHNNMKLMKETGITIYLEGSNETISKRLDYCKRTRPTIRHKNKEELRRHVAEAMLHRRPIYEQADLAVSIDHLEDEHDEQQLAEELARQIIHLKAQEP